jgi:hypothetical protein
VSLSGRVQISGGVHSLHRRPLISSRPRPASSSIPPARGPLRPAPPRRKPIRRSSPQGSSGWSRRRRPSAGWSRSSATARTVSGDFFLYEVQALAANSDRNPGRLELGSSARPRPCPPLSGVPPRVPPSPACRPSHPRPPPPRHRAQCPAQGHPRSSLPVIMRCR